LDTDHDWRLRLAAFDAVGKLSRSGVVSHAELVHGFVFEGQRIKLWDGRRGIWRPKQLGREGCALSVVTVAPKPGKEAPYDDQVASAGAPFLYRYEGDDPELWTNVAVRRAMTERRPIMYFYGIVPALYEAIYPTYVVSDQPGSLTFSLTPDLANAGVGPNAIPDGFEGRSAYASAVVKTRIHQRRFRELVVRAYRSSCTICSLRHVELLDAAHILSYREIQGRPDVTNGLSLCKIHHAAYDENILGVAPDYRVHVREDVLTEIDGPMLMHGLQKVDGLRLQLPRHRDSWPNRQFLEERYAGWAA
jgi:putative restriction endonuclease